MENYDIKDNLFFLDDIIKDIKEFCELNNITDINSFIRNSLIQGFNIKKYGFFPKDKIKTKNEFRRKETEESTVEVPSTEGNENEKEKVKSSEKEENVLKHNPIKRKIKIIKED